MSLINDALKRAKQAHQDSATPAAPLPQLKPVEPASHEARHAVGILIPVALGTIALLGLLLLWVLWKRDGVGSGPTPPITASARTPTEADTTAAPPAPSGSLAVPSTSTNAPAALGEPILSNTTASAATEAETNLTPALNSAPPGPPPLRLQSIVFNPKTPSAMINGRVVFLGDRVRDQRVSAIHRDEVVLIGGGRTNVLSLEP